MSGTSKSGELSETDSESSSQKRRHHYNTRFSAKNSKQARQARKRKQIKPRNECPSPQYQLDEERVRMDYCYQAPRRRRQSSWCWFLRTSFYLVALASLAYLVYTQYMITSEVDKLKGEMSQIKGGNKRDDPHAKLSKELDKKCSDTLKLLLRDPVGRPDFALESSGGRIVRVTAAPYSSPKKFLGFQLCDGEHKPSSMIQATTSPGECWAFKGQSGSAIIQLIDDVLIDSVTLEHIPSTISPSGTIDTAPKDFKIWGLDAPNGKKKLLGLFTYQADGPSVQTFGINNDNGYYRYVEFEVTSNHGNKELTCVYRVRVHGTARKIA